MSANSELSGASLARRLIPFYAILIALSVVVVLAVIDKGGGEQAPPAIAGGYVASAPSSCLGPAPAPVGGTPLPATAPTQLPPPGPAFSINQSGQFVNLTNSQRTLGGQLRLEPGGTPAGAHRLTGTVDCISGKQQTLNALVVPGVKGSIAGTLGVAAFAATLKTPPPAPGAALPRTPSGIAGKYALSPTSACFGSSFTLNGSGSSYTLIAAEHTLGRLAYSTKTSAVSGDVACTKGGSVRLTATANDILLQNVKLIPLQVATPVPSAVKTTVKPALITPSGLPPSGEQFTATKQRSSFTKLVAAFFLAVLIVLIVARAFGMVAVRIGQPRVMGEVIAGIALGPSLFGLLAPNLQATIFATDILPAFGVAANLGLIFFMFLIGMEVDQKQLKGKAAPATAISNASIALPMLLGIAAALPLYKLLGPDIKFAAFALFMGVAMSITAFPVLARILTERRMLKGPVGSLTIGCAAIDDVSAWFLIALATTIAVSGSFGIVVRTIAEAIAFVLVMALVVRRILARMATAFDEVGQIPSGWFAAIVVGVLLSACITEAIGIDVIFGGFIMGMVMPRHARLTEEVTRRVEDFVVTLLLPMFFVYTGLKTNITLIDRPELWLITAGLVVLAIAGKLAGAAIAARVCGFDSRASLVIGTLMNTRGLTELIVLNIALEVGAIFERFVHRARDHGDHHHADDRAAAETARPAQRVRHQDRGRARRRGRRRRPRASRPAGGGALDPRRLPHRRRARAPDRAGRAAGALAAPARADPHPPRRAPARRRGAWRSADREPAARTGLAEDRAGARAPRRRRRPRPGRRAELQPPWCRPRTRRRARARGPGADRGAPPPDRRERAARGRERAARTGRVRRRGARRAGERAREPRAAAARCWCRSAEPSTTGLRWSSARGSPPLPARRSSCSAPAGRATTASRSPGCWPTPACWCSRRLGSPPSRS